MSGLDNSSIFQNTVVDGPIADPFSGVAGLETAGFQPARGHGWKPYACAGLGLVPVIGWILGLGAIVYGAMHWREKGTLLIQVASTCIVLSLLATFFMPPPKQKMTRLRSGHMIGVLADSTARSFKGQSAMIVQYHTTIDIDDERQVRAEAREAFSLFRKEADRSGYKSAVLIVTAMPTRRFALPSKAVNVIFFKEMGKNWRVQLAPGERQSLPRRKAKPLLAH